MSKAVLTREGAAKTEDRTLANVNNNSFGELVNDNINNSSLGQTINNVSKLCEQ